MEEKLNLYQKIQAVSLEVMNLEKDMIVGSSTYGYKAVSDLAVTLAVKKAEAKYNLLSIPQKQELINSEIVKVQKKDGETLNYVDTVKMTVRIIDLDDVAQYIDIESFGKGIDPADKGFGKASTYARKYALLNAYKIATGEDPDNDPSKAQKPLDTPSEKRQAVVSVLLKDNALTQSTLQHFNLGSIDDLSEKQIETVYKNFKTKGRL